MSEPVFFRGGSAIALIADSHRSEKMLRAAAESFRGLDGVVLLGDCSADVQILAKYCTLPILAVRGNSEFLSDAPLEMYGRLFSDDGPRVLFCHGHRYHVKESLLALHYRAHELSAQAAFFGHTHIPQSDFDDGILLHNPGALCQGRYAVVYMECGRLVAAQRELPIF